MSRTLENANKERGILQMIRDYLRLRGWFVVRMQQGLGCHRGLSDLIAVKQGCVLFVEVKAPKGQQSTCQAEFQREIEEHGGVYVLAKSIEDLEGIA